MMVAAAKECYLNVNLSLPNIDGDLSVDTMKEDQILDAILYKLMNGIRDL